MEQFIAWWESNTITHLFFSIEVMKRAFPIVLRAFPVSITLGLGSFLIAIPAGLTLSFMKMAKSKFLRWPATVYVDVVRGTPLFLQIMLIFFGLPLTPMYQALITAFPGMKAPIFFGIDASILLRCFAVLSFNSSAYMCEIFRAGIQSIAKGQNEAARSLGMTIPQTMMYVILPQTVRRILPTMMSEFILLFKDTALLAAVSVAEMTLRAKETAATTFNQSAYIVAALLYLAVTIPLGRFVSGLENRLATQDGGGSGKRPPRVGTAGIDSDHVVAHSERVIADQE